jgi:tRNA (cytidine/uridine-2'-O-)-methyltransferase
MLHVVLFEPEIPANTGNIIRLCANTGAQLHLIQPLGFSLDDKRLRRAGLDYHEWATVKTHDSFQAFMGEADFTRLLAFSVKGRRAYHEVTYREGDALVLGPETRGLPDNVLRHSLVDSILRVPMQQNSRSLNLANAAAVVLYEAWRQLDFRGGR